jgi:hypothetical protein
MQHLTQGFGCKIRLLLYLLTLTPIFGSCFSSLYLQQESPSTHETKMQFHISWRVTAAPKRPLFPSSAPPGRPRVQPLSRDRRLPQNLKQQRRHRDGDHAAQGS